MGLADARRAMYGWARFQRARMAQSRHPDLGEISEYCFYAVRLRFRDLAFDIGANEGVHSLPMIKRGARVVAVEPQADLAADLTQRFPTATVLQVGVSDEPGVADLYMTAKSNWMASLDPTWFASDIRSDVEQVNVVTLAELIERYGHPRLIKIDTEGFDHRVLRTLNRPVEHIMLEVWRAHLEHAQEALRHLDALGAYEYRLARFASWQYGPARDSSQTFDEISTWDNETFGNVYARLLDR